LVQSPFSHVPCDLVQILGGQGKLPLQKLGGNEPNTTALPNG